MVLLFDLLGLGFLILSLTASAQVSRKSTLGRSVTHGRHNQREVEPPSSSPPPYLETYRKHGRRQVEPPSFSPLPRPSQASAQFSLVGPNAIIPSVRPPRPSAAISDTKVDCPVWPNEDLVFQPKTCVHVLDVEQYTHKVDIYRGPIPWSDSPAEIAHLRAVTQMATLSMKYAEAISPPLVVNLIMVGALPDGDVGLAATKKPEPVPCYAAITFEVGELLSETGRRLAHELYHCIQSRNRPERVKYVKSFYWWHDSTASYFSDYVAPTDNLFALDYEPDKPMYEQHYESSLFFHSLSNQGWSLVKITDYVNGRDFAYAAADERQQIAGNADLVEGFINFARDFHDKEIVLESVEPTRIIRAVTKHAASVASKEKIEVPAVGQTQSVSVNVRSWTFKKYNALLQPKQRFSLSVSWDGESFPQVHFWYRKVQTGKVTTEWARGEDMPAELTSGCDRTAVTYEFLVVPTDKADSVTGNFRFTRLENKKCKCDVPGGSGGVTRRQETSVDEDTECEEPPSCLVGTWSADKASYISVVNADANRYPSSLFTLQTTAVTGEYSMSISELPLSNDSMVRPLLVQLKMEEWKSVIQFTPTTGPNSQPFDTFSTMNMSGNMTLLRTSDPESIADLEFGSIVTTSSFSEGSIRTITPGSDTTSPMDSQSTPQTAGGTYNCTDTKLWWSGSAVGQHTSFYMVRQSTLP